MFAGLIRTEEVCTILSFQNDTSHISYLAKQSCVSNASTYD